MKKLNLDKIEKLTALVLALIVFGVCVYQLRFGIDVQDTSSYLTKFRYFFQKGTGGNSLYYLLGEFLGSLVFHVFPTLYAMNVTGLIVWTLTGILIYRILRPYLSVLPLTAAVLGGLAFSASWVRCVNWNAWSMLFLTLGILCLLYGFDTGKKRWIYAAGLILGINVFVRFPNIALLAVLALTVPFYALIGGTTSDHDAEQKVRSEKQKKTVRWKNAGKNLGMMVAGGATGGIFGCIFAVIFLGSDKFLADLFWLLGSSGDKESKHNIFDMFSKVISGGMDGVRQWIKYGAVLAIMIVLCILVKKYWKKDLTLFGTVLAAGFAVWIGNGLDVSTSSVPALLSVQNFIAYGGVFFGFLGAILFGKKGRIQDRRFALLCLIEALSVLALTIGTDTGSIFFRVYMAMPAAIIAAFFWKFPIKELRIVAVFAVMLTLAAGQNCNSHYVYHDGANGEAMDSTIDAEVFEGVYTTASRAAYVNRLIDLLEPYEEAELLTIGAFNIGHNVTDMKTFFDSAWSDLDYLSMDEFHTVLDEKMSAGNFPVIVIATTEINGAYWVPEKIEILEELVQTENYETIYSDQWYSVYVPAGLTEKNE